MLGGICDSHIENSTDLKNRLKNIGVRNKKLMSFDVESLLTNVPIPENYHYQITIENYQDRFEKSSV